MLTRIAAIGAILLVLAMPSVGLAKGGQRRWRQGRLRARPSVHQEGRHVRGHSYAHRAGWQQVEQLEFEGERQPEYGQAGDEVAAQFPTGVPQRRLLS